MTPFLLLYFEMSQPLKGKETINPIGMMNRTNPSSVSFRLSFSCIDGIREAQLEKPIPCIKKIILTAIRWDDLDLSNDKILR
jgi:hypothetical protein